MTGVGRVYQNPGGNDDLQQNPPLQDEQLIIINY
ncbi:hypothetical protein SPLC1_S360530 [Arthrospira platensis C1]|nr:hypothetical protein SPLC1_S360530 [Arthrospira platensis C1]